MDSTLKNPVVCSGNFTKTKTGTKKVSLAEKTSALLEMFKNVRTSAEFFDVARRLLTLEFNLTNVDTVLRFSIRIDTKKDMGVEVQEFLTNLQTVQGVLKKGVVSDGEQQRLISIVFPNTKSIRNTEENIVP